MGLLKVRALGEKEKMVCYHGNTQINGGDVFYIDDAKYTQEEIDALVKKTKRSKYNRLWTADEKAEIVKEEADRLQKLLGQVKAFSPKYMELVGEEEEVTPRAEKAAKQIDDAKKIDEKKPGKVRTADKKVGV